MTARGAKEWIGGIVHMSTIKGDVAGFKRGNARDSPHCGKQHLHRYLTEFVPRRNNQVKFGINDVACVDRALRGIAVTRLTYRRRDEATNLSN